MKFFLIDTLKSQMVHASWWYYFSKFTEFMDTVCKMLQNAPLGKRSFMPN